MNAEPERKSVRVVIGGRVQGVGFRYWTERNAAELNLDGWVRNRSDGTVEALFSGAGEAVDEMLARCRSGPRAAHVADVRIVEDARIADGDEPVPHGFAVRPTV